MFYFNKEILPKRIDSIIFQVILFVTVVFVIVPFSPKLPSTGLDPSWVLGMNEALAKGLVIGRDLVFTLGPYSSIYTTAFHPETYFYVMIASVYFAVAFAFVSIVLLNGTNTLVKLLFLVVLSGLAYSRDAVFFIYPLMSGLLVLSASSENSWGKKWGWIGVALVFSIFGLLPLIKGSLLAAVLATLFVVVSIYIYRKQWLYLIVSIVAPIAGLLIFWLLSKQPIYALVNYFSNLLPIISGYTAGMIISGPASDVYLFFVGALIIAVGVFFITEGNLLERFLRAILFLSVLFLAFKAGFVRHDAHALISSATLLLCGMLILVISHSKASFFLFLACFAAWFYIDVNYRQNSIYSFVDRVSETYVRGFQGFRSFANREVNLSQAYQERLAEIKRRYPLPNLKGSVDIYSFDQTVLIASGNRWSPRPVFQSYSAYTEKLAEMNRDHLLGNNKPDHILFKPQPIDGRLPMLEDGVSWIQFFSRYRVAPSVGDYVHLESIPGGVEEVPVLNISKFNGSLGDFVSIPKSNNLVFVKIDMKLNYLGRILNFLWKPSLVKIILKMDDGSLKEFRFIPEMAKSGFFISALVDDSKDFMIQFAGEDYLQYKSINAISIVQNGILAQYVPEYKLEFFEYERKHQTDVLRSINLNSPVEVNRDRAVRQITCRGAIDRVNDKDPTNGLEVRTNILKVNGWFDEAVDTSGAVRDLKVVLTDKNDVVYSVNAISTRRPDVGLVLDDSRLAASGFETFFFANRKNMHYKFQLGFESDGLTYVCAKPSVNILVNLD